MIHRVGWELKNHDSVPSEASESQLQDTPHKVKIYIISVRDSHKIFNRKLKFDSAFISQSTSNILQDDKVLYSILREDAMLVVEMSKFDLTKTASYKEDQIQSIKEIMANRIIANRNAVDVDGSETLAGALLTYKLQGC